MVHEGTQRPAHILDTGRIDLMAGKPWRDGFIRS